MRRALALAAALASPARADTADDRARAVELFEDGRKLLADDPAGACAKFDEAIQLEPLAAGTMLNLGLCNEHLGKLKTALYWFRKAQVRATETEPPLPGAEREARDHATRLVSRVATIRIVAPGGSTVTIDGESVRRGDLARVEIDPGHHVIEATAPGKPPIRQELDVTGAGGDTITLAPADTGGEPVDAGPPSDRKRIALWTGAGGAVALGASLALVLYEKHVYNDHAAAARAGNGAALAATRDATAIARDWGTTLAVAGVLACGVAGYFFFTAPAQVVPAIGPSGAGVAVAGRF